MYVGQHPAGTSVKNIFLLCTGKQGSIPVYVVQHPAGTSGRNIVYYVQVSKVVFLCMKVSTQQELQGGTLYIMYR